jgi:hypothetical protein
VPALNLALGLGMVWRATRMWHAFVFQPLCQITRDVTGAVIAEQTRLVNDGTWSQPDACNASSSVSVTSSAFMLVQSFHAMM